MKLYTKIIFGFAVLVVGLLFSLPAHAATLELGLGQPIVSANADVTVLVTINSETQDINTAQATITFPANLLQVTKVDNTSSIFSFWLQGPSFDNDKGTIDFVGGSTSGFNGASLKVMQVTFKVKGSGTGQLAVTNGAITASDGTGTNVYTTAKGLDINIPTTSQFQAVVLQKAQQQATLAKQLPAMPALDIPFYPDPTKWNNRSASFQANWKIGSDTTKAGILLDQSSSSIPSSSSDALVGTKIFPALADGISYIHLRFSNNIGWGPTLHYRLAIDTTPPSPFQITSTDTFKTANPKPTIGFASSDLTSGIDNYIIKLDGGVVGTTSLTSYTFAPLLPGTHQLSVSAVDKAGNAISQTQSLEILPIASPTITYVSRRVIIGEAGINGGGTASPDDEIITQVQNSQKQIVAEQTVPVDRNGNWSVTINTALSAGNYLLLATAEDTNMASSFPVVSDSIKIETRPMLVLGSLEITQTWFFIILILILLGSFGLGWFSYHKWRGQVGRRVIIAERDVINILDNSKKDLDKLLTKYSNDDINKSDYAVMREILKKMRDNFEKSHHYVVDNIQEINS